MAKGRTYQEVAEELDLPPVNPVQFGDLCLLAIPLSTFQALSVEAAKRNITLAQLLQRAVDGVLSAPKLLVEKKVKP
jgi:hypothetical protein